MRQISGTSKGPIMIYATCHVRLGAIRDAMGAAEVLSRGSGWFDVLFEYGWTTRNLTKLPDSKKLRNLNVERQIMSQKSSSPGPV